MSWRSILEIIVAILGFVGVIWVAANWTFWVDDCCAQQEEDHRTIEQLVDFQREVVREKEADAKQKRQVLEERKRLCLVGDLKNKNLCATVGVPVKNTAGGDSTEE